MLFDVPRSRRRRRALVRTLRGLPPGQCVVLRGRGSSVRGVAHEAHVRVGREMIALPSASRPAYLVEDDPAAVSLLCRQVLSVPPGLTRLAGPADGMLRLGGIVFRLRPARRMLRSRIAVGWRS
jgi:hypothetical protein